jgi:hypothetical protein
MIWQTKTYRRRQPISPVGFTFFCSPGLSTVHSKPGWQHTDISAKVDWHDLYEAGSRKVVYYCTALVLSSRVLLLFTGTGYELPGCPVQTCPKWSFLSRGGSVLYMIMCEWEASEGHTGHFCVQLCFMYFLDGSHLIFNIFISLYL